MGSYHFRIFRKASKEWQNSYSRDETIFFLLCNRAAKAQNKFMISASLVVCGHHHGPFVSSYFAFFLTWTALPKSPTYARLISQNPRKLFQIRHFSFKARLIFHVLEIRNYRNYHNYVEVSELTREPRELVCG